MSLNKVVNLHEPKGTLVTQLPKDTKIINIFGGPGIGKSTVAADLYRIMKQAGISVELVTEVAKDLIHEGNTKLLETCQDLVTAKQNYRQWRLLSHYEYVITDSPILLGLFYAPVDYYPSYKSMVVETFQRYDNINVYLTAAPSIQYVTNGRIHNEDQSREKSLQIMAYLRDNGILDMSTTSDMNAAPIIFEYLGFDYEKTFGG